MARSVASPAPMGYELGFHLGSGGMAAVHYGRRVAAGGFSHAVAIKELHPHLASKADVVSMFLDEARLAARVVHPNVVSVLDVVSSAERVWAVMQYIEGEPLGRLASRAAQLGRSVPTGVAVAVALDLLAGLDAAHRATDEKGEPLGIVHRDVSPQNVLVGVDGVARVLDFGVAKARGRLHETRDGQVKGKLAYMAPEQLGGDASPSTDVYAAAIVLWEMLAGRRLFDGDSEIQIMGRVLAGVTSPPSAYAPVPQPLEAVVMRALSLAPQSRFSSAADMQRALTEACAGQIATRAEVAAWVSELAAESLAERRALAAKMASAPPPESAPGSDDLREEYARTIDPVVATVVLPPSSFAPPPRKKRRALTAALVGVALSLVAVTGVATVGRAALPSAAAAAETVAPAHLAAEPTPTAAPGPPAAAEAPSSEAPPADTPTPAAEPSATGKRRTVTRRRFVAPPKAPAPSPAVAAAPAQESCDPPFVVDAAGVRHYKRACIR
ncbi:MAG: serine/threonine-protein kinase [Polyangiaceae bacterium]